MVELSEYEAMAKLRLNDDERQWITGCMENLMQSFNALEKVNTDSAEPLITVLDIKNALRDDLAIKKFSREEILANAPEQYNGCFQVPKTLD